MFIINLINRVFYIYSLVLVVYALLSWFPNGRQSGFGQLISKLARPYLDIFDQFIPPIGGLSFNVIIGIFVLELIQRGLMAIIMWLV